MNLKPSEMIEAAGVLTSMASLSRAEAFAWIERATPAEFGALLELARMPRRSTLLARLLDAQVDRLAAERVEQEAAQSDSEPDSEPDTQLE